MGTRPKEEMQAVRDAIAEEIKTWTRKDVLTITANEMARQYGINPNTATTILKEMGFAFDGVFWYKPAAK
jgi:hypothetical protein